MAGRIKRHRSKAAKVAGAALFILLMFLNMQLTINPNNNGDIDLFGLNISLGVSSTYAKTQQGDCNDICDDANNGYCTYLISVGYCFGHWN
ncbi:MAG: hypothetical protein WB996_07665 [Ignavibacteriaceae bacterium]